MNPKIESPNYWNDDAPAIGVKRGAYVAVSGNTGAGKSTLIRVLQDVIRQRGSPAIAIDERVLHHPLLRLMFSAPKEFSLLIQLNFLIQRHLILYRWLSLGHTVLIERSHLDDSLFIQHHLECGHVTEEEYSAYAALALLLDRRLPDPDVYVYLDSSPEVSMLRLADSESKGERPKEFPDDVVKWSFVQAWYRKYNSLYDELVQAKSSGNALIHTEFLRVDTDVSAEHVANTVLQFLQKQQLLSPREGAAIV